MVALANAAENTAVASMPTPVNGPAGGRFPGVVNWGPFVVDFVVSTSSVVVVVTVVVFIAVVVVGVGVGEVVLLESVSDN